MGSNIAHNFTIPYRRGVIGCLIRKKKVSFTSYTGSGQWLPNENALHYGVEWVRKGLSML